MIASNVLQMRNYKLSKFTKKSFNQMYTQYDIASNFRSKDLNSNPTGVYIITVNKSLHFMSLLTCALSV